GRHAAERDTDQGNRGIHAGRLGQERFAVKRRYDPVAAVEKLLSNDGAESLGAVKVAGGQSVEEEERTIRQENEQWSARMIEPARQTSARKRLSQRLRRGDDREGHEAASVLLGW